MTFTTHGNGAHCIENVDTINLITATYILNCGSFEFDARDVNKEAQGLLTINLPHAYSFHCYQQEVVSNANKVNLITQLHM